jgi:hypothetical protein
MVPSKIKQLVELGEREKMIEYKVEVIDEGDTFWYKKGTDTLHRENGTAVEWGTGTKEWWIDGQELTEEEFNKKQGLHSCILDGKEIKMSEKRFEALKKHLGE